MCSVGPSSTSLGSINLDMVDYQFLQVELLGIGVGFKILEKSEEDADRLFWPPSLCSSELACLSGPSDVSVEAFERHATFFGKDIKEVFLS